MEKKTGRKKNIGDDIDFEYEDVLDKKTQGLIRAACSVVASCPS